MVSLWLLILASVSTIIAVNAVPQKTVDNRPPGKKGPAGSPVSTLTADQIHFFKPYTHYAAAAFCGGTNIASTWTCGTHCEANPSFKPVASGGDGSLTQFWFVGYDPTLETVIVSYQGADPAKIIPLITGAIFVMSPLSPSLFPGIGGGVQVHHGFGFAQEQSATEVLEAVETTLTTSGFKKVTIVGHSPGASIALISSVCLPLHLPADTVYRTIVYASPRAFAEYLDAQ